MHIYELPINFLPVHAENSSIYFSIMMTMMGNYTYCCKKEVFIIFHLVCDVVVVATAAATGQPGPKQAGRQAKQARHGISQEKENKVHHLRHNIHDSFHRSKAI